MTKQKTFEQRLNDLYEHSILLSEACQRFRELHKLYEIRTIASKLRILIDSRHGNNLLFDLTKNYGPLKIFVLESHIEMTITEIEQGTNNIIQQVTKRELVTNPIKGQPTLPIITTRSDFVPWLKEVNFEEWLDNGVFVDWVIPNDPGKTSEITRLSPRKLIKAYADTEASHSDKSYAKDFGCSVEELSKSYIFAGKPIIMPVMYNYLYQIGQTTAKLSLDFYNQNKK